MHGPSLWLLKFIHKVILEKMARIGVQAAIVTILLIVPIVISDDTTLIPADKTQAQSWYKNIVQGYTARKGTLDPALVTAESGAKIIKVRKDGSGDFKTVTDAIKSIPAEKNNTNRVIVWIGGGVYNEKILIEATKPFITFYGSPNDMPQLSYGGTAAQYGTVDSATLIVMSDYFMAVNVLIKNSAPRPDGKSKGAQAVALRISGDKAAFYNCKIIGFQDTICDDSGRHFFKNCYIEGTVDFIFGSAKSLYVDTELHVLGNAEFSVITAQARKSDSEDNGYSFVHCTITGTGNNSYLGRAWMPNAKVVFAYTDIGSVINPQGWSDNFHTENDKTVFYGEYNNKGAGSNTAARVKFAKVLSDAEAKPFISLGFIEGSKWLLPPTTV